mgnify:CR=1 FL=1
MSAVKARGKRGLWYGQCLRIIEQKGRRIPLRVKIILINITLVIVGLSAGLFLSEILLRILQPNSVFGAADQLPWMDEAVRTKRFMIDPDLGFRPVTGGQFYNEYGTRVNDYSLNKRPGVARLLFIGDSITSRGMIIEGLKKLYGEDKFEYWNGGVESFNTAQEIQFYNKYNYNIRPDHVILTFCLNDFTATPVVFFDQKGQLIVYAPRMSGARINYFLFKKSRLYRFCLGCFIVFKNGERTIDNTIAQEVRDDLGALKEELDRARVALTVLIAPALSAYEDWSSADKEAKATVEKILKERKIRYFDLSLALPGAVEEKINMRSRPEDQVHPGAEMGRYLAGYLYRNNLLEE